jgi:hypothetical protein
MNAISLFNAGLSLIQIRPGSKAPVSWKPLTKAQVKLLPEGYPYGILLAPSGLVVLDADDITAVLWAEGFNAPEVATSRGRHFYFKRPESLKDFRSTHIEDDRGRFDLKATGYCLGPSSGHPYGGIYLPSRDFDIKNAPELPEELVTLISIIPSASLQGGTTEVVSSAHLTPERRFALNAYVSKVNIPDEGQGSRLKVYGIAARLGELFPEASTHDITEALYRRAIDQGCQQRNGRPFDYSWIESRVIDAAERTR